jgi:hypothetical protein
MGDILPWVFFICHIFIPLVFIIPAIIDVDSLFYDSETCKDFKKNGIITGQLCETESTPTLLGLIVVISTIISIALVFIWCVIGIICLAEYLSEKFG